MNSDLSIYAKTHADLRSNLSFALKNNLFLQTDMHYQHETIKNSITSLTKMIYFSKE